jgi:ubiquinone/menaquinone biosynthesis C-methylase UbiE
MNGKGVSMSQGDIFQSLDQANEATLQNIIKRLEFRDRDSTFTRWRSDYLDKLDFKIASHVLDVGCGTGVVTRALARREGFSGKLTGVDYSPVLIEAAQKLAVDAQLDRRIDFKVGDIHALEYDDASFDIVVVHTVLSHVKDPVTATKEVARVTKPKGKVVIFDGDYGSWKFAYPPDADLEVKMEQAFLKVVVGNPRVMRDLPVMFRNVGLGLVETMSYVLAEIGTSSFWASFQETFGPLVAQAKLLPEDQVNAWLTWQRQAAADGNFFSACNYYTYIAQRPEDV